MKITTDRLTMRPWQNADYKQLYNIASNPNVAIACGFLPHDSTETSKAILQNILINNHTWAITLNGTVIGCISIDNITENGASRYEIGYWLGESYWGKGYMPEAVCALSHYAIYTLGINTLWCAYSDTNDKSHTVQDKCHFVYHHTHKNSHNPRLELTIDMHYTTLTRHELDNYPTPTYNVISE